MRVRHLTDDEVINLLLNPTPDRVTRERARRLKHFTDCGTCHERFNEFARLISAFGDREVWEKRHEMTHRQREWLPRVKAALHQIGDERAGLDEVLEAAMIDSPVNWKASLALHDRFHTYGMVEALIERAIRLFRSTPAHALDLSGMAVAIADQLPLEAYPFDLVISLRARAYREHAVSLSYVGRVVEALPFLDQAERLVRQTPTFTFELARIAVARALIYRDMDRVSEAVQLTHEAAAVFSPSAIGCDTRIRRSPKRPCCSASESMARRWRSGFHWRQRRHWPSSRSTACCYNISAPRIGR